MSWGRTGRKLGALAVILAAAGVALSGCGSQPSSARVAEMIEAKYGVHVVGCTSAGGHVAVSAKRAARHGLWICELSEPRTDKASGVTDRVWCVANATADDLYESARLAYPRSMKSYGCR